MSLKFCANLNFLFSESGEGFLGKYRLAKQAGFKGVESSFPIDVPIEEIIKVKKETNLEHVLLNISTDGTEDMQLGCASLPHGVEQFRTNLYSTVKLAKAIGCNKIHVMAGIAPVTITDCSQQHNEVYLSNLKHAANIFEMEGLVGVIEPINKHSLPGYFLNCYSSAVKIINKIKSANLKLLLDIFHLQHIRGNIIHSLLELSPYVGHIQVAQVPHRHEPNVPGELDYQFIFQAIEDCNYSGWVGLEYKPMVDTVSGLSWLEDYGYSL